MAVFDRDYTGKNLLKFKNQDGDSKKNSIDEKLKKVNLDANLIIEEHS